MTVTGSSLKFSELRGFNIRRQTEWDADDEFSLLYYGNAMAGECGEACNVIKKLERTAMGKKGSEATLQDLAEELADVVIYADLLAHRAGINLGQAIQDKFNKTSLKYNLKTLME